MNELTTTRTPEIIGAEIRFYTNQARATALNCAVEIGRRLVEAKEMLPHGEWTAFLENQTEFNGRKAERLIQIFNGYADPQGSLFGASVKSTTLSNLSISNALSLLALPEEERESFAEEVDAEHISNRELEKLIKEKKELEERLTKSESEREKTAEDLLKEQAARKAEVEKLTDELIQDSFDKQEQLRASLEQEINNAKAEAELAKKVAADAKTSAEDKFKNKEAKLKAEIGEAEAKAKAAEAKAAEAEKKISTIRSETEAQIAEVKRGAEEAAKKLKAAQAAANPDITIFKVHFQTVQQAYGNLLKVLAQIKQNDAESGAKLEAALITQLNNYIKAFND